MNITERTAEVIRKAKAILPLLKDETIKAKAIVAVQGMEETYLYIVNNNIPCPPNLEQELTVLFTVIEQMYNETAAN